MSNSTGTLPPCLPHQTSGSSWSWKEKDHCMNIPCTIQWYNYTNSGRISFRSHTEHTFSWCTSSWFNCFFVAFCLPWNTVGRNFKTWTILASVNKIQSIFLSYLHCYKNAVFLYYTKGENRPGIWTENKNTCMHENMRFIKNFQASMYYSAYFRND